MSRARAVALVALVAVGGASACARPKDREPRADEGTCACAPARRGDDGACCPLGEAPNDEGRCAPRAWTTTRAIGPKGARAVRVAVDERGALLAAIEREEGAIVRTSIVEETARGFREHDPASAIEGTVDEADVAANAGSAVVVFRAGDGPVSRVYWSERDARGSWLDPSGVADARSFEPRANQPRVVIGASGEALVVANQWYGEHFGVALHRRADPSSPWESPRRADDVLSPASFYSNSPTLALGDHGEALVAWYQSPGGPLMTFASERPRASARFERPDRYGFLSAWGAEVDSHGIANPTPALALDGRGAVVWTQEDGVGGCRVYLARRDARGGFTRPRDLEDSVSRGGAWARAARPAFDASGELWIAWEEERGGVFRVLVAHGTSALGAPIEVSSLDATAAIAPAIVAGRDGTALVAWSERVRGRGRVALRRLGASEPGPIELASAADDDAFGATAAVGGARDRYVVAWISRSAGRAMVRALK